MTPGDGLEKAFALASCAGDHVMIYMEMAEGKPKRIWWEKFHSPNVWDSESRLK